MNTPRPIAAVPAPNAPVKPLKVIDKPEAIPNHLAVLSAPGQKLQVRAEDQRAVALLRVAENQVIIVWTNRGPDLAAKNWAKTNATQAGFSVAEELEAPESIIRLLYAGVMPGDLKASTYRGQMDALFDEIVEAAVRERASDIRINVKERHAEVKFRVFGRQVHKRLLSRPDAENLTRAIYNDFADQEGRKPAFNERMPLTASISRTLRIDGQQVALKLRYESGPLYPSGWRVVMRVLRTDTSTGFETYAELGFNADQIDAIHEMVTSPSGVILICGTTGSGKSTTLRAAGIDYLANSGGQLALLTVEDPVEYVIPGAEQTSVVQLREDDDQAFTRFLRSALRSDPDAILVGEVRDEETAKIMVRACQTGHLLLSTLHAENCFVAFDRLQDQGVRRQALTSGSFIAGLIWQSLVPVLCPRCKIGFDRATLDVAVRERITRACADFMEKLRFRGEGCTHCNGIGVSGRTVVAEFLRPDRQILEHIRQDNLLAASAYWRGGMAKGAHRVNGVTRLDHAMEKIRLGLVSPVDVDKMVRKLGTDEPIAEAQGWYLRNVSQAVGR